MDNKHRCENKCIFCFIDQNPEGMRESIYFKDDDSRLSFLHGNYITLTNLKEADIDRIIEMHISPVNVSVHTTNPELRVKMMKNKRSGEVLDYLGKLADAGIKLRGQIVLCKGINDGAELDRSMNDLYKYYPQLDSVSIVPAGLTRYRDNLYPLEPFNAEEALRVIRQVKEFGDMCLVHCGERVFYCSDEFYLKAGVEIPDYDFWGEFSQIENGVGLCASLLSEFESAIKLEDDFEVTTEKCIITGELVYDFMCRLVKKLNTDKIKVYKIKNEFFGSKITVSGLLVGSDIINQLKSKELPKKVVISKSMLRHDDDIFLDNTTVSDIEKALNVEITAVNNDGFELFDELIN